MNRECWTSAHVNAYRYFGGVTRMIQCDNLICNDLCLLTKVITYQLYAYTLVGKF